VNGRTAVIATLIALGALASIAAFAPEPPVTLVVCAPGYPGSTAEAQPAMDALAAAVGAGAGWKRAQLKAIYFETEQTGLDRLAASDAALLLAPLPLWLKHRGGLALQPHLQAVEEGGEAAEAWTLVAPSGAVTGPAGLAGFELTSIAGYSPRFIRGTVLGGWGELPPTVTIAFSNAVVSGLRRASAGGKVAVLLDRAQAAALPTLPFAARLQVVTRSMPLPVSVLSVVRGRLPAARLASLLKGFTTLTGAPAGRDALAGVRLARFVPADQAALVRARDLFARAKD